MCTQLVSSLSTICSSALKGAGTGSACRAYQQPLHGALRSSVGVHARSWRRPASSCLAAAAPAAAKRSRHLVQQCVPLLSPHCSQRRRRLQDPVLRVPGPEVAINAETVAYFDNCTVAFGRWQMDSFGTEGRPATRWRLPDTLRCGVPAAILQHSRTCWRVRSQYRSQELSHGLGAMQCGQPCGGVGCRL